MSYEGLTQEQRKTVVDNASRLLFEYCQKNNLHYTVTGVSGGLDSAVVMGIAAEACKLAKANNFALTSIGVIMPCDSKPEAKRLGYEVIRQFKAEALEVDLSDTYRSVMNRSIQPLNNEIIHIRNKLEKKNLLYYQLNNQVADGNIKARLRMITLYHIARQFDGLVLSTDNLSEYWMGFWTICGDVGDYSPIQQVMKGLELYDIAEYLGISPSILNARPDADLGASCDEDQLGAPYRQLDAIMVTNIQNKFKVDGSLSQLRKAKTFAGIAGEVVEKILKRCLKNSYKRKGPVILTRKQLGLPELKDIVL